MSDNKCVTIMSVDADEMICAVPIITPMVRESVPVWPTAKFRRLRPAWLISRRGPMGIGACGLTRLAHTFLEDPVGRWPQMNSVTSQLELPELQYSGIADRDRV